MGVHDFGSLLYTGTEGEQCVPYYDEDEEWDKFRRDDYPINDKNSPDYDSDMDYGDLTSDDLRLLDEDSADLPTCGRTTAYLYFFKFDESLTITPETVLQNIGSGIETARFLSGPFEYSWNWDFKPALGYSEASDGMAGIWKIDYEELHNHEDGLSWLTRHFPFNEETDQIWVLNLTEEEYEQYFVKQRYDPRITALELSTVADVIGVPNLDILQIPSSERLQQLKKQVFDSIVQKLIEYRLIMRQ